MIEVQTVGDPEAMRAMARDLRHRADRLQGAAEAACGEFAAVVFEGPAAPAARMAVQDVRGRVQGATQALIALAAQLSGDADRVEQQNADLRREAEEAARKAEAEASEAATIETLAPADAAGSAASVVAPAAPAPHPEAGR